MAIVFLALLGIVGLRLCHGGLVLANPIMGAYRVLTMQFVLPLFLNEFLHQSNHRARSFSDFLQHCTYLYLLAALPYCLIGIVALFIDLYAKATVFVALGVSEGVLSCFG
ncbi:MAG: hypothetical protein IPM78_14165 [Moraxellaceae bacterium]|nr:hypothetical protein [Moraxellaceae bacterium]